MEKQLKYYFNSEEYSEGKIQETITQTQKDFPNKDIKSNVTVNEFGVYVITFEFENKNTYFNRIRIWFRKKVEKRKHNKIKLLKEKNGYKLENKYGQYQTKGTFKPY